MIVLALDTATLDGGVAVWRDGQTLAERQQRVTTHSEALLPMIDEALKEAHLAARDLAGVVCGAGPGSFTGLRIGLATAKGLCFALGKPLVLVSSLAALAARAPEGTRVCATLDAFKNEVYAALFVIRDGLPVRDGDEQVLPPARLVERLRSETTPLYVVGSGALRYPELVLAGSRLLDEQPGPRPRDVARLGAARLERGEHDDLRGAAPTYIRPSEAELMREKLMTDR
jgi:tRNA threonylcarbamoyladenosine biosynthesis protein TsaB